MRSIRLRKHLTSQDFKGSVFLEMGSVDEAQALMDKTLVHEGATLVRHRIASVVRFACVWLTRSLLQKLEWKASYTERKAAERRDRPNSVLNGGPPPRPAVLSSSKPQEQQQEGVRFAPGTVVAFSLGACVVAAFASFGCVALTRDGARRRGRRRGDQV